MSEFTEGQRCWHDLHGIVTIVYVSGGYAYIVTDETDESFAVPENELRDLDDYTEQLR